jgi:hypothetical protein
MSFCKKCGQEVNSGEPFCGNCGASVVEVNNLNSFNEVKRNNGNNFNIYANEILEVAKGMLKKPVSTILNCDEKLEKESCGILVLVLSVLFGIINVWNTIISERAMESLFSGSSTGILGFGGISQFIGGSESNVKVFFIAFFLFIIGLIILAGSNYLIGKQIFKSSVTPLTIVKVTSCSAIPFIVGLFLNTVLSYISVALGFVVLFTGIIVALISLFRGITEALSISEEITIFIIPISYLLMFWVEYMIIASIIKSAIGY